MNFATDRDLLVLEPNLFRDIGWVGQRLTRGAGSVSGTTLTIAAPEVAFDAAGVGVGNVAVIAGVSYEVIARLSATQATLSRLRASTDDAVIPPTAAASVECVIHTFEPQLRMAHRQILRMAGVEADDSPIAGDRTESQVYVEPELTRLECLGALSIIWAGAAGLLGSTAPGQQRAEWYRERFMRERDRVRVRILPTAPGRAEEFRSLNVGSFVRG